MGTVVRWGFWIAVSSVMLALPARAQRPSLDFLDVPERPHAIGAIGRGRGSALGELEGELSRFDSSARAYRASVDRIVRRRFEAERRALTERYDRAIRAQRIVEDVAPLPREGGADLLDAIVADAQLQLARIAPARVEGIAPPALAR